MTGVLSCGLLPRWCTRHRFLPAPEDLDDPHGAAAAGAWLAQGKRDDRGLGIWHNGFFWALDAEQGADLREVGLAGRAGQQAVMPDAVEPVGQDMDQEAANELRRGQPHDLLSVSKFDAVILPTEGNGLGIRADQAGVGDSDAVRVSAQVSENGLRAAKGRFGIDHPFNLSEPGEPGGKRLCRQQSGEIAEEFQLPGAVQAHEPVQKQTPKQPRQHPHMQEEPGLACNPLGAVR